MAYDSPRNSTPPKDFLEALKKNKKAAYAAKAILFLGVRRRWPEPAPAE